MRIKCQAESLTFCATGQVFVQSTLIVQSRLRASPRSPRHRPPTARPACHACAHVHGRAEIAVELLHPAPGRKDPRAARVLRSEKRSATKSSNSGVSVSVPLSVTSAGTRPFGFTARYSPSRLSLGDAELDSQSFGRPAPRGECAGERKSGSQWTPRWRKRASNCRSLSQNEAVSPAEREVP
jgi:hypothetical protein